MCFGTTRVDRRIFLPSFGFVAALSPFVPRLRQSPMAAAFLAAVNASAMALMAAVTFGLARDVLVSWPAWVIAVVSAIVGTRWKVNAAWLVLGGAIVGRTAVELGADAEVNS